MDAMLIPGSPLGRGMKVTQKKINYTVTDPVNSGNDASDPFYTKIHSVRDLAFLNRKNMHMTTKKGVPYLFGFNVMAYGSTIDMTSTNPDDALSADNISNATVTMRFYAPINSWVHRNASVKTHVAREKMFRDALVSKSDRGAYSQTIRYCLEANDEDYLMPVSTTSRSAITGGTWDHTQLIYPGDSNGAYLKLTGTHNDEETTTTFTELSLPQLYFQSRVKIEDDSNETASGFPADTSILNKMLSGNYKDTIDEVTVLARDEQDNPPYSRGYGDVTDLVEVGRLQFNPYTAGGAGCYIEIPFGVCKVQTQILDYSDSGSGVETDNADISVDLSMELVSITEM